MLETFRKYTGLMFVVLILLFVGLVFFGSSGRGVLSGPKVLYAHDRGYTAQEVTRFAEKPARMLKELAGAQIYTPRYNAVEPFLSRMGVLTYVGFRLSDDQVTSFLVNRVSLHKAMKEFGVSASTAEAEQFLKETVFWENGTFNETAYDDFVENSLPKLGMTVKQMNELVGEMIALKKLEEIVGAGVEASREAVLAQHLASTQRITYKLVSFPLSEFLAKQEPAEDAIKEHWEDNKKKYQSEPKRRITYLLVRPDYAALEKKLNEKKDTPGNGAEADPDPDPVTPEAPEAPKPVTPDSKLTEEDRKKAVNDLAGLLDEMHDKIYDANGGKFEELAKANGFEIKTTELVEKSGLPAELSGKIADDPEKTGADLVFELRPGTELKTAYGDIKKIGSDQWFLFRVDEAIEPVELSYEDAREKARLDVAKDDALKAMEETAKAKRTAVLEAMQGGKSFTEAAKELELNPTPVVSSPKPQETDSPEMVAFTLAAGVNPGELSEVKVDTSDDPERVNRALFVYVEKREVPKNDQLESVIARKFVQAQDRNRTLALANWFAQQQAAADLKIP